MKIRDKKINGITVKCVVERTFDGQPIPVADFYRAIKLVSDDLQLTGDDLYFIYIDDLNIRRGYCGLNGRAVGLEYALEGKDIVEVVAHELRHAWQIKNGLFSDEDRLFLNKVDSYITLCFNDEVYEQYMALPSEVDANNYAESICKNLQMEATP